MDELWQYQIRFIELEPCEVSPIDKYVYRYQHDSYFDAPTLSLRAYPVLRETRKGCWIKYHSKEKWVDPKSGGFAQETKKAALRRFIRRKTFYRSILGQKYDELGRVLEMAEKRLGELDE